MAADSGIDPDELQAYADGRLPSERRLAVQAWLAAHPDAAAQVAGWQAVDRALHLGFDEVLNEPLPLRLVEAARAPSAERAPVPVSGRPAARGPGRRLAVALLVGLAGLVIGSGLGYRLGLQQGGGLTDTLALVQDAAAAHAVYVPEQRHPVEVEARQADHLVAWLSKRLGTSLQAPQLAPLGYALLGGRLLSAGEGPVAQFMYQEAGGGRLTLYVRRAAPAGMVAAPTAAFQYARQGDVDVFYWVEDGYGYALSGRLDRPRLQAVAEAVYRQLTPPAPPRGQSPAYSPTGTHEQNRLRSP
jgi:anti-sigma factor RsiW